MLRLPSKLKISCLIILLISGVFSLECSATQKITFDNTNLSKTEIIFLGERMYREGILPDGTTMPAYIKGDVEVDSSAFSCSSCHLRAGLGSVEGGVITPPTTGVKLYKTYRRPPSLGDVTDQAGRVIYAKTIIERPPYTRETLAKALRFGIDPAGQIFNDVMPRYPLSELDMSILTRYLEILSSDYSPGASSSEFRFATIITDEVSQKDRQALLLPLQDFIDRKNQQLSIYNDFIKFGYTPTSEMKYAFRRASIDIWELKGPPDTWQSQLKAYSRSKPVFAVLGGISYREWQPIHNFCEVERLPCLFPITEFPVISETGWYTYYFNKGYAQEGDAVARYINRLDAISTTTPILQIIQDSQAGKALSGGFDRMWKEQERAKVISLTLSSSQLSDKTTLSKIISTYKPEVLLLWTDEMLLPDLPDLISEMPTSGKIFMSSSYLGKKVTSIAERIRNSIYLAYPYRLTPYVGTKTGGIDSKIPILASSKNFGDHRITSRTTAMLQQTILQGLNLINDDLYRDHLLDVMSMQMDLTVMDYERFSFGPGQRYASKGCYIIQLGPGIDPALIQRSEWVMP